MTKIWSIKTKRVPMIRRPQTKMLKKSQWRKKRKKRKKILRV
jgi:hypothetical protein